jgi:hypothetical protein
MLVRKALGLPEFSFADKVKSRINCSSPFDSWGNGLPIPLEKGERFWVYLVVVLAFIGTVAVGLMGSAILGFFFLTVVFMVAFIAYKIGGALAGLFR